MKWLMFSKGHYGYSLGLRLQGDNSGSRRFSEDYFLIIQERDDGRRGRGGKTDVVVSLEAKATRFFKRLVDSYK